jgi:hypothetical protein
MVAGALTRKGSETDTMHDAVMTGINQVTTAWLTSALVGSGALTRGAVASFELRTGQGNWSPHILLDGVSETHFTAAGKEPSLDSGLALAEGLAVLHARCWIQTTLAMLQQSLTACDDLEIRCQKC